MGLNVRDRDSTEGNGEFVCFVSVIFLLLVLAFTCHRLRQGCLAAACISEVETRVGIAFGDSVGDGHGNQRGIINFRAEWTFGAPGPLEMDVPKFPRRGESLLLLPLLSPPP